VVGPSVRVEVEFSGSGISFVWWVVVGSVMVSTEKAYEVVREVHDKSDDDVWFREDDPRVYILNDVSDALYQKGYEDVGDDVVESVTDQIIEEN
jgi:hypothetical protein